MFIDANIFLSIILGNESCQRCKEFIKTHKDDDLLCTSDFVIYACLLVIQRELHSPEEMEKFLTFINSINITIFRPSLKTMVLSLEAMKEFQLDFDDALVIGCMREYELKELVSYDKHFRDIKGIGIIQP